MDPTGGSGIGKAATEMMKEMQKAQEQAQQLQDPSKTGGASSSFQQHMDVQKSQTQVSVAQDASHVQKATNILQQAKVNANTPSTRVGAAAKAKESKVVTMMQGLIGGQDKMTKIMKMALSGRQMNPQELLAMQAGVYRFSQELDLTSKVVEKATSGIKQTMNTQV
jgi:hypothetical protein